MKHSCKKRGGTGIKSGRQQGQKSRKVLLAASVASMIDQFNMSNIQLLQKMGYEVHVACNFLNGNTCDAKRIRHLKKTLHTMGVIQHQWDCPRSIYSAVSCRRAYLQLAGLTDRHCFAWIHCHSPIGGALARVIAHQRGIKVIYTAHGFHFYQDAPLRNWVLYYPAEKLLAHWTDVLITVNKEDYRLAKRRMKAGKVCYIPGVGIDTDKFAKWHSGRAELCSRFGIPKDAVVLLSVGELNRGKNHRLVISALAGLSRRDVYYLICGQGAQKKKLQRYAAKLGVGDRVRMPGFCEDMPWIYQNADIFVFPSVREGMPVALMEAMAAGMPCVVSDIRGNRELIDTMRFSPKNCRRLQEILEIFLEDQCLRERCGIQNRRKIESCSRQIVNKKMRKIYEEQNTGMPVKILHVLKTGSYSGAENVAITICQKLHGSYKAAYTSLDGSIADRVREAGVSFYPMKRFGIREMAVVLRKYRPNIVHAHDFTASVLAALLKKDNCLVSHLHNNPPWIRKWHPYSIIYRLAMKKMDRILVVSEGILEEAVFLKQADSRIVRGSHKPDAIGIRQQADHRVMTVYNPTDAARIRQLAGEFWTEKKDLVFVGRLTKQKNPMRFIRIVDRLRKHKEDVSAVMIGTGELEAECRGMVQSLGLEENIQLLGFQKNPYPYICQAGLMLVTSDWEGYGLAAAEAAALGTPVLAVPAGGLRTIFRDFPKAFYTTEEEACKKALYLLQDQTACQKFRQEMCERALVQDTGSYIKQMESIYEKLCGETGR